jgi:hypothetical protein
MLSAWHDLKDVTFVTQLVESTEDQVGHRFDSLQVLILSQLLKQLLFIGAVKRCLPKLLAAPYALLHHVLQLRLLREQLKVTDAAACAANECKARPVM